MFLVRFERRPHSGPAHESGDVLLIELESLAHFRFVFVAVVDQEEGAEPWPVTWFEDALDDMRWDAELRHHRRAGAAEVVEDPIGDA